MLYHVKLTLLFLLCGVAGLPAESFDSDGVRIQYRQVGDRANADGSPRPVVLLIHGYMASGRINWDIPGVTRRLAEQNHVILLDNRGHGLSDKPTKVADYGDKMAADAIRLLDHLEIQKVHVVGYSMGGMITLRLAALHPERLESAVVAGMGWLEPSRVPPASSDEAMRPLDACRKAFPRLAITREQLTKIRVPMTVIIGTDDSLRRRVDRLTQVRPDIPIVTIEGANHVNTMFREEFREAIADWLVQQTQSTPAKPPAEPAPNSLLGQSSIRIPGVGQAS